MVAPPPTPSFTRMSRLALLVAAFLLGLPALAQADVFDAPVAPALAGTLPPGFTETTVWSGLGNPTALRFAPDGRVFVASKSGIVNVFDGLERHDADAVRRPAHAACTTSGTAGCWAWRSTRASRPGGRTSTCSTPTTRRRTRRQQPRWGDGCPSPPGATDDGCVITGRLSRLNAAGRRDGADRGLLPAVPEPLARHDRLRPRRDAVRVGGDGASFNWADYGQDGSPVNPCGDPAQRGRRAALAELPPRPRPSPRRSTARSCAWTRHGRRGARQPGDRQRRPAAPADRRLRPAQSVPLHLPPRHGRDLVGRRRLEHRRGDQPHAGRHAGPQLRLAVLRGRDPAGLLRLA